MKLHFGNLIQFNCSWKVAQSLKHNAKRFIYLTYVQSIHELNWVSERKSISEMKLEPEYASPNFSSEKRKIVSLSSENMRVFFSVFPSKIFYTILCPFRRFCFSLRMFAHRASPPKVIQSDLVERKHSRRQQVNGASSWLFEKNLKLNFNWRLFVWKNWSETLCRLWLNRLWEQNIVDIKDFYQHFPRTSETLMCIVSRKLFKYGICFSYGTNNLVKWC